MLFVVCVERMHVWRDICAGQLDYNNIRLKNKRRIKQQPSSSHERAGTIVQWINSSSIVYTDLVRFISSPWRHRQRAHSNQFWGSSLPLSVSQYYRSLNPFPNGSDCGGHYPRFLLETAVGTNPRTVRVPHLREKGGHVYYPCPPLLFSETADELLLYTAAEASKSAWARIPRIQGNLACSNAVLF